MRGAFGIAMLALVLGMTWPGDNATATTRRADSYTTRVLRSTGVVVRIDKAHGRVRLRHAGDPALGLKRGTRSFPVADVAQLENLKRGDRVRFVAEERDGAFVVMLLMPAPKD